MIRERRIPQRAAEEVCSTAMSVGHSLMVQSQAILFHVKLCASVAFSRKWTDFLQFSLVSSRMQIMHSNDWDSCPCSAGGVSFQHFLTHERAVMTDALMYWLRGFLYWLGKRLDAEWNLSFLSLAWLRLGETYMYLVDQQELDLLGFASIRTRP